MKHIRRIIRMAHLFGGWDTLRRASELALWYETGLGKSRPSPFSQYLTKRWSARTCTGSGNVKPVSRRSLSSARVGLALTLALGLGACADALTGTIEPPAGASRSLAIATPSDAQVVAQSVALAMRDPSIRRQVHRAMRGSRFNEHKLVLQDWVKTPEGENLFSAATKSSIANLPALDFYLPFKTHRQTWKPTADVYVAVTFDPDAPAITAFGTNGQTLTLRQADGVPTVPLIILHPAEPKATRSDLLSNNSDEDLIESPSAKAASNSITSPSVAGPSFMMIDDGGSGGSGSVSTTPAPGTYITHFNIQASDGWFGQEEMRFQSYAIAGHWDFVQFANGSYHLIADYLCDKGLYSQDAVNQYQGYYGPYLISPTVSKGAFLTCNGYPATYAVHMYEVDGDIGQNDDYGWRFYAAGYYPSGTTYDVVYSFYANTFPQENANLSAYFRLAIY